MHEPVPTYEELKHRLARAEASLHTLRQGQMETMTVDRTLMTRLAEAEARSEHIKQVLQAIRTVNHLIMFEDDPLRLIEQACVNLTETMGYLNAWIALMDTETRTVTATADSGFNSEFKSLGKGLETGQYPDCMQVALERDDIVIIKEPKAECTTCPLAQKYGGRAGLSRRLHHAGRTYGILSVSVPAAYAFDEEEQAIFGELAINLAFALHRIEAERIRCAQVGIYTSLYENNHAVILLIDPEAGAIADANPAAERFFGWSRKTLKGMNISELNTQPPAQIRKEMQAAIEGRRNHFFFAHRRADGTMCDVEVYAGAIQIKERELLYSFVHDITERKQAEEALRETTMRLQEAIRATNVGLWDWDLATNRVQFSAEWKRQIGYEEHEIKDDFAEWENRVHPDDLGPALAKVQHAIAARNQDYRVEFRFRHKDGSYRWILALGSVLTDATGRPLRALGSHIDITDRKRMEDALRESEARNRALLHALPDMMFVFDRAGVFLDYHTSEKNELLMAPEHFIGRSVYDVLPATIAEMTLLHIRNIVENGETLPYWYEVEKEGATKFYESRLVACGENKFLGIVRDVTERKQAEEELRRRENQLQRIFEILPIGLWFADKEGTLLRGNSKGIEIWGAEPTVPISEYGVFKAWHLPSRKPVEADQWALVKTIRNGETIVDELLEIESFDGKRKTILNYTAPVLDDDGQVDGAIVVNLDISDRKALEDQLLQAHKMESIGRLAGGVAHDFNNMLGVILGYSEMLQEQVPAGKPMHKAVYGIHQAAQRSAALTRQLLAFARKQTVAPKVLDLNETVAGMLTMLRRLIGEDIDLAWLPGQDLGPIMMDPSQVDQILANLCVNARDAIGGNTGKVTIETANAYFDQAYCAVHAGYVPGNYVLLAVSDDGCGMDAETLAHLFEPFYTTKEMGEGTGLGSAMVYGIVRQNNGFINVYSEPGQGTTFKMYLPRFTAKGDLRAEAEASQSVALGAETILLVEDEPMILEMVNLMLQSQGYHVLPAATPGEAIRLARKHAGEIHLLMTDVVMPEMNGRELARNLLSLYPALKCLFMSGYTANVIAHHGVLDAGVHFIQKPFSRKDLVARVRDVLDNGNAVEME